MTGQRLEPGRAVLACRVLEPDQWCRRWRQDTTLAAEPRAKLSRRGLRWALEAIVVQHLTVARIAEGLSVAWNTASDAVPAEGKRALIDDTTRFDGVTAIGVDEHVRRHTRLGRYGGRPLAKLREARSRPAAGFFAHRHQNASQPCTRARAPRVRSA